MVVRSARGAACGAHDRLSRNRVGGRGDRGSDCPIPAAADLVRLKYERHFRGGSRGGCCGQERHDQYSYRCSGFGERACCQGICQQSCASRRQHDWILSGYPGDERETGGASPADEIISGTRSPHETQHRRVATVAPSTSATEIEPTTGLTKPMTELGKIASDRL
jgi:hypothetical protein